MNESQGAPKILFAIVTCLKNRDRQQILQETWLRSIPQDIDWVFVQGGGCDEMNLQAHTLNLNTKEGYEHLARKSYDLFSYIEKETDYDYVVKIDDDAYVEPQNVQAFIAAKKPDYAGKRNIQPHESGNTPYAQGGFYVLSRRSLEKITAYRFEDGQGSLWWYGGQAGNKAWKSATDEVKANASIEDLMVGQVLLRSGTRLKTAFGSFDFDTRWHDTKFGSLCIRVFLRTCFASVLSFHPADTEDMKKYYTLSQKARGKKRGFIKSFFAQTLSRGLFSLGILNTFLYTPFYIWHKNK